MKPCKHQNELQLTVTTSILAALEKDKKYMQALNIARNHLMVEYSKIPWYPKLFFQRENALASF
jgi:hypothetical protein